MYKVAVNSFAINVGMADSLDDMQDVETMRNEIPNYEGSGSGNYAQERIENVATVGADENGPGTRKAEPHISHPFHPPLPYLLSVFIAFCYCA